MNYQNPIISGFHPDPSICQNDQEEYFLVTSSFEYFPSIPLFKSTDLVNWQQVGHVLTRQSQLDLTRVRDFPTSQGVYAPTIRFHLGRYYVITTNMTTMETFYVWTDDPESAWSEPIYVDGFMGYDPSLYFEGEMVCLTAAAFPFPGKATEGIIQATIDIETGQLTSELRHIWQGTGHSSPEGPHLYKKDQSYYLMVAEGGTEFGHMVTIARSDQAFGPFEANPNNPIASNRSTTLPIQAIGHADMLASATGEWLAVMLGIRPLARHKIHHLGRETMLAPVTWTKEGWPIFGDNGRVKESHKIVGTGQQSPQQSWSDNFKNEPLASRWNTIRHLEEGCWSVSDGLRLNGKAATLNSLKEAPVFIGCRQDTPAFKLSVTMEFMPAKETDEAGVTVYMNEHFHYDVYRLKKAGKHLVRLRKQIGDISHIAGEYELSAEQELIFKIEAKDEAYFWSVEDSKGVTVKLGQGEARLLAKEVAGGFTGVFLGMYATGNGEEVGAPALFKNFSYEIESIN